MKIRIRYKNVRETIDLGTDDTLQVLRQKLQHIPPPTEIWWFSLNGTDPITESEDTKLSDLGLVNGDLLHIIEDTNSGETSGDSNDLEQQLIQMGFSKHNVEKVIRTFGAKTLNDAIELLSMLGESSGNQTSASFVKKPVEHSEPSPFNAAKGSTSSTNTFSAAGSRDLSVTNRETSSDTTINREREQLNFIKPLFLADGITDKLTVLVSRVKIETPADYLFLVVHLLIRESGLTLKTKDARLSPKESNVVESGLPSDWRNTAMGFYRMSYTYKSDDDVTCSVTGTITGKSMVVTGSVDIEDLDAHQCKLNIDDFVERDNIQTGCCESIYKNLNKLSLKIKNNIANKMIDEMRAKLSLQHTVVGLATLPEELKLRLLCYLNPQAVCRLSQTTREWNDICGTNEIWRRLLYKDFGEQSSTSCNCKRAYKERHIERREEQRRLEEERRCIHTPLRPDFDIGMPDILRPQPHPQIPGMIGGRHDLYPADFPEIGIPRNNPLRIGPPHNQPGRVPGARFDPYGPIPDDGDEFGNRPIHPDSLQRPRFGRGDGFGSGGGGFGFM